MGCIYQKTLSIAPTQKVDAIREVLRIPAGLQGVLICLHRLGDSSERLEGRTPVSQ